MAHRIAKSMLIAATLLAGAVIPLRAHAEGDGSSVLDMSVEELTGKEVSAAGKTEQKRADAPASVIVITKEDIRRHGYRTVAEALQSVIGLYVSSDRTYEYLGVRGFNRPGDNNGRILLLINGHKITDPNFDFGPIGEDLQIDIQSVQKIEVVKGPGSALWGTNALLGVINIVTKRGRDIQGIRTSVEYGAQDRSKYYAEAGDVLPSGLEYSGALSLLRSQGEDDIYFPEFDTPETNFGLAEDVDHTRARRGYLQASYQDFNFFIINGWRKEQVPAAAFDVVFNDGGTYTTDNPLNIELNMDRLIDAEDNKRLVIRTYYDDIAYHGDLIYDVGEPELVVNKDRSRTRIAGVEARYGQDLTPDLSLIVGTEFQRVYRLSYVNYDENPYHQYYDVDGPFSLFSTYMQTSYRLFEDWTLIGGIRLDDYSTSFGATTSPRAALVYTPLVNTSLKLLYGSAFRAPTNVELNASDGEVQIGNPNLDEERAKTLEFVAEQRLSEAHRLSLSLFRYRISDIISQVTTPDELLQYQNVGRITSKGAELWWTSNYDDGLRSFAGASVVDAEDENGSRISNSPRTLFTSGISIPFFQESFYLSPSLRYVGEVKTLEGEEIGSGTVANLTLASAKLFSNFETSFSVYNVFDSDVYAPGAPKHTPDEIPQEGRTWLVQLGYKF